MIILKVISVAIISVVAYSYLKSINSEISTLTLLGGGIIILLLTISHVISVANFFKELSISLNVDLSLINLLIKVIAISYMIEFAVNLCEEVGAKSISSKVSFAGRVILFTMTLPIIKNLFEVVLSFIE